MIFCKEVLFETKRHQIRTIIRIVAHFVPKYLQKNRMLLETNCIDDWETKVNAIVEETFDKNRP